MSATSKVIQVDSRGDVLLGRIQWSVFGALLSAQLRHSPHLSRVLAGAESSREPCEPVPLTTNLRIDRFSCGVDSLDGALRRAISQSGTDTYHSQFFAFVHEEQVIGYYSRRRCFVRPHVPAPKGEDAEVPAIPIVLLSRLAVDMAWQNRGVGRRLLAHLIRNVPEDGEAGTARALLVHALTSELRPFYLSHGFHPMPAAIDPLGLLMTVSQIRAAMDESRPE